MVVLRLTAKLRSFLPTTAVSTASDTALGDWYVNRIVVERQPLLWLAETPCRAASIRDRVVFPDQKAPEMRPGQGPVIAGAGGARQIRWARAGSGKRGGVRVIYYWAPTETAFYMLFAYAKNEQGDLTPGQAKTLGRLVREEFK